MKLELAVALGFAAALTGCGSDRAPDASNDQDVAAGDSLVEDVTDSVAGDPSSDAWAVSARMFGSLRLGTTVAEASTDIGDAIDMSRYGAIFDGCDHVRAPSMPGGTALMVIDSTHVARVDVDTAAIRTTRGVGVGSTEQEVIDAYRGAIRVEPHHYTGPEGHYLVYFPPGDTTFAIVFETDGSRVTSYRAGRQPEVMWVEGCA